MSDMNVNQLLAQMRTMSIDAGSSAPPKIEESEGADFGSFLKQAVDSVNDTQKTAGAMVNAFETGESDVSVVEVMVSLQKASVSFQAMTQVRNKLVSAYQDIMNMPM